MCFCCLERCRKKLYPSIQIDSPVTSKLGAQTSPQVRAIFAKEMAKEVFEELDRIDVKIRF
jgi:cell division GTPase FtsZ